jgi:4-alpha-glucanotransferase
VITPAVARLRDSLGLPGMVVLQFGFDGAWRSSPHWPGNHVAASWAYTGTHDHDTVAGWYGSIDDEVRERVDAQCRHAGVWEPEPWWRLIRLCLSSQASVAMMQAQDLLGLGSEARMNFPGRRGGNWRWQLQPGALTPALARRLREATAASGRLA